MKLLISALLALCMGAAIATPAAAVAADASEDAAEPTAIAESAVEPRLFTTFQLGIQPCDPEPGYVTATVLNSFTLFPTTVTVNLYLYSSLNNTVDFSQMTLEAHAYIYDLDQGHTLEASASTNNEAKYWVAVIQYQTNGGDWKIIQTDPIFFNADGSRND